jgi:hypothetical protein
MILLKLEDEKVSRLLLRAIEFYLDQLDFTLLQSEKESLMAIRKVLLMALQGS